MYIIYFYTKNQKKHQGFLLQRVSLRNAPQVCDRIIRHEELVATLLRAKLLKILPVNSMVYECFICRYTHTWGL